MPVKVVAACQLGPSPGRTSPTVRMLVPSQVWLRLRPATLAWYGIHLAHSRTATATTRASRTPATATRRVGGSVGRSAKAVDNDFCSCAEPPDRTAGGVLTTSSCGAGERTRDTSGTAGQGRCHPRGQARGPLARVQAM